MKDVSQVKDTTRVMTSVQTAAMKRNIKMSRNCYKVVRQQGSITVDGGGGA